MAYTPTNWTNFPSTATPVNASNLNKIENELVALDTGKADESAVTTALAGKVDKVDGKGLSENDYTTAEKTKLAGISAEANKVEITPVVTEGTTLATISIDGVDTDIKGSDIDVDDEMSPTSTNPVQNKVITDALEDKADKDGNYEDMAVGQLLSNTFEEDKVPYNFRTSGGTLEIGDREYDTLVGGTVAFNQLVKNGNFVDTSEWTRRNVSLSVSGNIGTIAVTDTNKPSLSQNFTAISGHKYFAFADVKATTGEWLFRVFYNGTTSNVTDNNITSSWKKSSLCFAQTTTSSENIVRLLSSNSALNDEASMKNVVLFDLTQMFGSTIADYIYSLEQATAGSGVSYFRSLFPKDYYSYNVGQLMSVKALSHKMVGFNQWDEVWELGGISSSNGNNQNSTTMMRSKNYIPVVSGATYYFKTPSSIRTRYYDSNKNYIGYEDANGQINAFNNTRVIPSNCEYIRFALEGTTYKNDICINLHWDGERDGEYEAYEEHIYPLDSDLELRGIPKLDANNNLYYDGDTYESDGTVTRKYALVDLGSLTYTRSQSGLFTTTSLIDVIKKVTNPNVAGGKILSIYTEIDSVHITGPQGTNPSPNMVMAENTSGTLYFNNTSYSTVEDFKTAMNGVKLIYELATPTTETADTFENPQLVDNWGTEEYTDSREVQIPVGHITKYPPDLKAKLESAPDSPASDGDYILRHSNGVNTYVADTKELPTVPTTDGTYVLKATVSSGTATLSWVAE